MDVVGTSDAKGLKLLENVLELKLRKLLKIILKLVMIIVIYPVDSIIHLLNNRSLVYMV